MLVHFVLFWLRDDLTAEERADFRAGVETLKNIDAADAVYVGTAAPTAQRPVVDATYDVALTVLLKDVAAHDVYQDHAIHQAFIAAHKAKWTQVKVYDAE